MLFSHISHKLQHPIQFLLLKTFKAFKVDSSYIKFFWIEGLGDKDINDEMCGKMPIFSDIRQFNKCVCVLFMQKILFTMNFWYIFTIKTFL